MTAVEIARAGPPEVLRPVSRAVPSPGPGEVLIRVSAAGVNRPDVFQRLGRYPPPSGVTDVPGLEVAGVVTALGVGATRWHVGDQVCALLEGGGYAEYCTAPAAQCLPVPPGLDLVAAAALPETYFTVWTNVFDRGRLAAGETLLVHGGAGGIGTTAIQLGVAFGARVLATAGSPEKCAACERLGAERAIDYRREDFVEVVHSSTGGRGADVVLDMVGGDYVARNLASLGDGGRLVQIAFLRGSRVEVDLLPLMQRRLTVTGSLLRPRTVEEKGFIARVLEDQVWPLLAEGRARPVVYRTFPLDRAADAHRVMEAGEHVGKLVLVVAGQDGEAPRPEDRPRPSQE